MVAFGEANEREVGGSNRCAVQTSQKAAATPGTECSYRRELPMGDFWLNSYF